MEGIEIVFCVISIIVATIFVAARKWHRKNK
jgi:ABC-type sulfate transport system permease subunit